MKLRVRVAPSRRARFAAFLVGLLWGLLAHCCHAAVSSSQMYEVESAGSDTTCAGGFDPSLTAHMLSDLAATAGNTTAPVVTSATYTFVAGDVNQWLYVASGTNWIAGWYQISSVTGGAATLDGTIGHAVLAKTFSASTVAGCASLASPTSGTGTVDYSQHSSAVVSSSAILSAAQNSTTLTSTTAGWTAAMVGNCIQIRSGTNFTTGFYSIISFTDSKNVVIDRAPATSGAGSSGTGYTGGALATPGEASFVLTGGGSWIWIGPGTYSETSTAVQVAGGEVKLPTGTSLLPVSMIGYNARRCDQSSKPELQVGVNSGVLINQANAFYFIENLLLDGNKANKTTTAGLSTTAAGIVYGCKFQNFNSTASSSTTNCVHVLCEATGCQSNIPFQNGTYEYCSSHDNTIGGFAWPTTSGSCWDCISANNSGAGDHGFKGTQACYCCNCTAYNNGGDGFSASTTNGAVFMNCLSVSNGAYGFGETTGTGSNGLVWCCACGTYNNTTGAFNAGINVNQQVVCVALAGTPFNGAGSNDFSLNNVPGAGQAARSMGMGSTAATEAPGLSTLSYTDIGASQHPDPAAGSTAAAMGLTALG